MTHIGRCITAKGVKPIVRYRHAFKNTYLYGAFSPIDGDSFVSEIQGTTSEIFYKYIHQLSLHRPHEFKIVVIDNAGFHSLKHYKLPENIRFIRIPPYSPELNPCEKIWAVIKQKYKNRVFETMGQLKDWLRDFIVSNIYPQIVKSITHHPIYMKEIKAHLNV